MTPRPAPLSIFTMLYRHSPRLLVCAGMLGAFAGALYALIIPTVLAELTRQSGTAAPAGVLAGAGAGAFFLLCVLILVAKAASIIMVNNIAKEASGALRLSIAARIGAMSTDGMESEGLPRLLNVLVEDVNMVTGAAVAIPMLLVSSVTVVGMMGYLATLDLTIFGIGIVAIALGVLMFALPVSMAGKLYRRARIQRDLIQEGARGLVSGAYELKLDRVKAARYLHEEVELPQRASLRFEKLGDALLHIAGNASDLLSFFVIGLVVFILPRHMDLPPSHGIVMAMLYIAGPIAAILAQMRQLQLGQVAVARIGALDGHAEDIADSGDSATFAQWSRFGVRAASYRYPQPAGASEAGFALAPASIEFERGQINFIVGGNGSGKSTLSKLISLHYQPATGGVYFDGCRIDRANLAAARLRVAVIFSNYYLFPKLYRAPGEADQAKIARWIDALGLRGKTECIDGRFTTTKLSDGQRRRLALLVALLEDRDIYIFDEWAADQDPAFKQIFYRDILQEMKRDGKLVIVITHDDRYFDCADRVIFMESGAITEICDQAGAAPARLVAAS